MRDLTNYTYLCELSNDQRAFVWTIRIYGCISIPLDLYCSYLIINYTPKNQSRYRTFLLVNQFFNIGVDFTCAFLVNSVNFFPLPMGYSEGLLNYTSINSMWQIMIMVLLGVESLGCTLLLLLHRVQCVIPKNHWLQLKGYRQKIYITYIYTGNFLSTLSIGLLFELFLPSQVEVNTRLIQELPCLSIYFNHPDVFMIDVSDNIGLSLILLGGAVGFLYIATFSSHIIIAFQHLERHSNTAWFVSDKTRILQKKLIKSLLFQISLPTLVIFFPTMASLVALRFYLSSGQVIGNIMFLSFSMYGSICSVSIIYFNTCYLERVKILFNKPSIQKPIVTLTESLRKQSNTMIPKY